MRYEKSRFAFALLPAIEMAREIELAQTGIAKNFPVHVTLRGRFAPKKSASVDSFLQIGRENIEPFLPFRCQLSGPIEVNANLIWYESKLEDEGYITFLSLHHLINSTVIDQNFLDIDDVSIFSGNNFRPHLTLNWHRKKLDGKARKNILPSKLELEIVDWCIFEYCTPPWFQPVGIIPSSSHFERR